MTTTAVTVGFGAQIMSILFFLYCSFTGAWIGVFTGSYIERKRSEFPWVIYMGGVFLFSISMWFLGWLRYVLEPSEAVKIVSALMMGLIFLVCFLVARHRARK